jgi:hypothetical protein
MALTDIARQLKDTFDGFGVSERREELARYRDIYGEAECVRIGKMDYIVINQVYESKEYADVPESTSPLFYNSINNSYAIIDAETSSTLIDEVYSRVTYMQRVCRIEGNPEKADIRQSVAGVLGKENTITDNDVLIKNDDGVENKANIFQCQLIMDTGVSAAPGTYSFMLKNGEIKEIPDNLMRQIKRSGEVNLLRDRQVLEQNSSAIQQAVFDKYDKEDMDIQSITVKSIFEISMSFLNIHLMMKDDSGRTGVYHTTFLASENNDFAALNANIHVCNECGHELIDVRDPNNIHKLHINMDAYDKEFSREDKKVHAVGCEDCLIQCPDCGGWHFDYAKFVGSRIYEKVELAPGREFIRGLRTIDANYCACREGIEWIYDERSGTDNEHDIIPAIKMAFVNYANEMIASYEEYKAYYDRKHPARALSATDEQKFAKKTRTEFKKQLASRFDIDTRDISITSIDKCSKCTVCGGEYYRGVVWGDADDDYRCNVCDEMVTEKRRSVTRIDGIVFMRRTVKKKTVISKYIVTKLGNLKEISSAEVDLTPTVTEEEEPFDEVTVEAPNKDEVGKEEKK